MTVTAQISEADVILVHPDQTAYFTILGEPDKRYYGKLRAIEPAPQNFLDYAGTAPAARRARAEQPLARARLRRSGNERPPAWHRICFAYGS